jgi:hypothetical protein
MQTQRKLSPEACPGVFQAHLRDIGVGIETSNCLRGAKQDLGSPRPSFGGVRCQIVRAEIRFGLHVFHSCPSLRMFLQQVPWNHNPLQQFERQLREDGKQSGRHGPLQDEAGVVEGQASDDGLA